MAAPSFASVAAEAATILHPDQAMPYADDLEGWVRDVCDEAMWSKQRDLATSLLQHRYTACPACHDAGKSWFVARAAAHWIATHPIGEAIVVWTAPTFHQTNSIVGEELRVVIKKSGLPGEVNLKGEWRIGDKLVGIGRKPSDHNKHGFQGIHRKYVLVIVDEACGVPKSIFVGVDAIATNEYARVIAIGNPDEAGGEFENICKEGSGWNVVPIDGYDTPNFTDENVPDYLRPLLLSKTWVEERRKRWGENSQLYLSKVRARFPKAGKDTLIEQTWISKAMRRELDGVDYGRIGADIARYGGDESVAYRNRGGVFRLIYNARTQSTTATKGALIQIAEQTRGQVPINIDADGIGGPIYDDMADDGHNVFPFHGGRAANEPDKYFDRRSEGYWHLREMFRRGEADIDPEDEELQAQLGNLRWRVDGKGKIRVETKDEMRKRNKKENAGEGIANSPDRADGCMMSVVDLGDSLGISDLGDMEDDSFGGLTDELMNMDL